MRTRSILCIPVVVPVMLVGLWMIAGCESEHQQTDGITGAGSIEIQKHAAVKSTHKPVNPDEPNDNTDTTTSSVLFSSVDANHLQEAQYTLTSRLEILLGDGTGLPEPGITVDEMAHDQHLMVATEKRYLAYQRGFREGVFRGINKPVVSVYFPERLPSKTEQLHWSRGQGAGHDYGVFLLKQYLSERFGYTFNTD